MKWLALVNPEYVSEEEGVSYLVREAARAVVVDRDLRLALLHVSRDGYYKLPGGGMEEGEDDVTALRRECREELGCELEILGEIGMIVEYRKMFSMKQVSYCYFARVQGSKGKPTFTLKEKEEGFEVVWLPYTEALKVMVYSNATTLEGREYIVPRDTIFIRGAEERL